MVDSFEADIFSVSLMSGRMVHLLKQVTNALNISFKTLYHNQFINSVDNTKVLCYTLPLTQQHCFFRKLPALLTVYSDCAGGLRRPLIRKITYLILYTLTSASIFSLLFTVHFGSDSKNSLNN